LAIRENVLGPDHKYVASSLNNLAGLYIKEGKYEAAEPLFERSLAIYEKALGPDHPDVAATLSNLGVLYKEQARYSDAEPLFDRALDIFEKALGRNHPDVAPALMNRANLYRAQGNNTAAVQLLERSLAIIELALGPDHSDVGMVLSCLASMHDDQGNCAAAEPLFERSLAIREDALGPDHPDVAGTLNNLGMHYYAQGDYAAAVPLLERALAINEAALGVDHPDVAGILQNLAGAYGDHDRYAAAEPLYERSLEIFEKAFGPNHPYVAQAQICLAVLYDYLGNVQSSADRFVLAAAICSRHLHSNFVGLSERERLLFARTVDDAIQTFFSFGSRHIDKMPGLATDMMDASLWYKHLVGRRQARERRFIVANANASDLRLYEDFRSIRQQISNLVYSPVKDSGYPRQLVDSLVTEAQWLEKQLARQSYAYAQMLKVRDATWVDVRDRLEANEAAIQFLQFPYYDGKDWTGATRVLAFVVLPGAEAPILISLGEENVRRQALEDYQLVVGSTKSTFDETRKLTASWQVLWQPLESALGDPQQIYVSLEGDLNLINLGLLKNDQGEYLMDRYELRYLDSLLDLLDEEEASVEKRALLVGNPSYGLKLAQRREAVGVAMAGTRGSVDPVRGDLGPYVQLDNTAAEVVAVESQLAASGWNVGTLLGDEATEEVLKRACGGNRLLHLATHGYFLEDLTPEKMHLLSKEAHVDLRRDPLLRSGIVLAGANDTERSPGLDDGYLTAYEVQDLDLQGTELVVLSACETGLGTVSVGEGVFGLRRALAVAGAGGVLMSLWSVPDKESRELMGRFYGHWLEGMSPYEALQMAQREQREAVIAEKGRDLPYYWGAFVYVEN